MRLIAFHDLRYRSTIKKQTPEMKQSVTKGVGNHQQSTTALQIEQDFWLTFIMKVYSSLIKNLSRYFNVVHSIISGCFHPHRFVCIRIVRQCGVDDVRRGRHG